MNESDTPTSVAYDLGWSDGWDGRPMRRVPDLPVDEERAYLDGYRLGERHRGGVDLDEAAIDAPAIRLIRRSQEVRQAMVYVAVVCAVVVFVMVGLVVGQ